VVAVPVAVARQWGEAQAAAVAAAAEDGGGCLSSIA
jgi:hypothetical protein